MLFDSYMVIFKKNFFLHIYDDNCQKRDFKVNIAINIAVFYLNVHTTQSDVFSKFTNILFEKKVNKKNSQTGFDTYSEI